MKGGMTVLVTGGAGNLGAKIAAHLSTLQWCQRIVLADRVMPLGLPMKTEAIVADFGVPTGAWRSAVADADAVVHLAADNPYPGCSWTEAANSLEMTANVLLVAADHSCRFVFASSNHVMGRYKEMALPPASLTTELPPKPGTRFYTPKGLEDSPAYATAKLMGERLMMATAAASAGGLTGVALRIGWCQPGENHPRSISADGLPLDLARSRRPDAERDLSWFRSMWLSNRDLVQLVAAAIRADSAGWPGSAIVVNAMSANAGMPWDLGPTKRFLGYSPQDNVWAALDE